MKRTLIFIVAYVVVLSTYASFVPDIIKKNHGRSKECQEWVDEKMSHMSLKEKIGQLFIYTVSPFNTKSNKKILQKAVDDYKVGGLLFSGGQLTNQALLTNYAQDIAKTPLFIAFDGEWGLAMRLRNMPSFPKNRVLGSIKDNELIYKYGQEIARQCREIGVHINFAPVADVDNNPNNPVINTRSFGGDVNNVANKVIAYAKGLESGDVLSVSKHFPGHGDTEVDSHKSLPLLSFDRNRLDSIEFVPFRKSVAAGLGGVMVGHLNVPSIGNGPASLSKPVIDVLKNDFGFEGIVFSDALDMKGVSNIENICSKALAAGNDILLAPKNLKRSLDDVLDAVKNGVLTIEQIDEKCRKVLTYKYYLGLDKPQHIQMSGLEKRVKTEKTEKLIEDLYKASITVLGNGDKILPLDVNEKENVLVEIGNNDDDTLFYSALHDNINIRRVVPGKDSICVMDSVISTSRNLIVVINSVSDLNEYRDWIINSSAKKNLILVYMSPIKSFESERELWQKTSAIVLGNSDLDEVQRQLAKVLIGKGEANGTISVDVDGLLNTGDGVEIKNGMHSVYRPESYGMDSKTLSYIDTVAIEGIREGAYPGCQVVVLKDGMPVYDKAFGMYSYNDTTKVNVNSIYDLASLTKTTATLLAVMKLYDDGRFGLTDKISKYVPALRGTDKERITIEELLTHQSGLLPSLPFYNEALDKSSFKGSFIKAKKDKHHSLQIGNREFVPSAFKYKKKYVSTSYSDDYPLQISDSLFVSSSFKDEILHQIASSPLKKREYVYSCLNFMLLKEMVENISGTSLDAYLNDMFYKPMRLENICFNPLEKFSKSDIVPTVKNDYLRKTDVLQGYVHDEAAAFMGGVSGNAGLFSDALDVAKVYSMIIDGGCWNGKRYLSQLTCDLFLKYKSKISRRGLGFDKPNVDNPEKSPCSSLTPACVVGHTGFTGTCAWADPDNHIVYVFLSNRIYPQPYTQKKFMELNIRPRIQQIIYQSIKK